MSLATDLSLAPLPVSPEDFETIISTFAREKRSTSVVTSMVAAVNHFHRLFGFPPPAQHPRVQLTLKGIQRAYSRPAEQTLPLSPSMIQAAIHLLGTDLYRTTNFSVSVLRWRTVAAMAFSFSSLARYSCMTRLKLHHITFYEDGLMVTFPSSKTDQLRQGKPVFVSRIRGSPFCPVMLMKAYTLRLQFEAFKGHAFPFLGFLFPAIRQQREVSTLQNKAFSPQAALKAFRELLEEIGLSNPKSFSLHSGRRGGATAAAMNGCDFLSIKRQGRWKSDTCPQLYIDEAHMRKNNFSMYLGLM